MIYFIQGEITKRIKVGYTCRSIGSRIANLQIGSPDHLVFLGACAGNKEREKMLHNKFSYSKVHGEWFKESTDIKDFILANCITSLDQAELANIVVNEGIVTEKVASLMEANALAKIGEEFMAQVMEDVS